jgi:hypothetical protein
MMMNRVEDFANKHYCSDIVSINANNIVKLHSLPRVNIEIPRPYNNMETCIKYAIYLNALNFRFWELVDGLVKKYSAFGQAGAPALDMGMRQFFPTKQNFDYCFPNIPDKDSRIGFLYDLSFGKNGIDQLVNSLLFKSFYTFEDAEEIAAVFPVAYGRDPFLKRAQLCIMMIAGYHRHYGTGCIIQGLTLASDYSIPRVLRHFGVLQYSEELAAKVDGCELIHPNSKEEYAIRSATILAGNMIADEYGWSIECVDTWLWQNRNIATAPFHLTETTDY